MEIINKISPSELNSEGITKELLNSINMVTDHSPVQLNVGDEPVNLLQCKDGFWITPEFGEFLKDEKGKLIVVPEKQARIGRARYIINHQAEILEAKIQKEVKRLQGIVMVKADEIIKPMKNVMFYSGKEDSGLNFLKNELASRDPYYVQKKEQAEAIATDDFVTLYNRLKTLIENKDYDSLYVLLFQNGLPEVASFDVNNEQDMETLVQNFHANKIVQTVEDMQGKPHLYNVAKFNILKKG